MNSLQQLRKKLQIHERDCREVEPDSEVEVLRRDLSRRRLQIQIECEEWRHNVRMSFLMCQTEQTSKRVGESLIFQTTTIFEWEKFRDSSLKAIAGKEIKILADLDAQFQKTYHDEKAAV